MEHLSEHKNMHPAPFRLTSTAEEPADEQLHYIMEQVGIAARESSRKVKEILDERMAEVKRQVAERRKKLALWQISTVLHVAHDIFIWRIDLLL